MRAFCNLVVVLGLMLLSPRAAHGCDCAFGGSAVCQDYWTASAVFVGTVIEVKTVNTKREDYEQQQRLVSFSLDEPFRGVEGAQVEVLTGMGGGDCGIAFKQSQQYLVYASLFEGKLYTGICMRTKAVATAVEELKYIHGLKSATTGGSIYGTVTSYQRNEKGEPIRQPRAGARVAVTGPAQKEASTDTKGAYRLDGLPAGDYTVTISPPEKTSARQSEQKISLANGGCAVVSFWLENDGRLSGRILNPAGLPVNNAEIFLSEFNKERYRGYSDYAYSDPEGRYAFKSIPPGRYVLTIRFDGMTSQNRPFPVIYYPGVSDRAQAKVISIGEGQVIADYDLEMPPLPLEYEVNGSVVWSDGKPAVGARVGYMVVGDSVSYGTKNEAGAKFSLKAYAGLRLAMRASIELEKGAVYSNWVEVTVMAGLPPLKLIMPQP
jgi:hypothetical protein